MTSSCILGQRQQRRVDRAIAQFDIGHIGDGLSAVFDPVADRAAGMIERCGSQGDARPGIDHVAGTEVVKFKLRVQRIDLKREERKAHQLSHRLLDAAGGLQAAGPDADDLALHEQRREERQADHMVDVAVAQEDVEVGGVGRLESMRCRAAGFRCRHRRSACMGRSGFPRRACCRHSAMSRARDRQYCPGRPRIEPISRTPTSTLHSRPLLNSVFPPISVALRARWPSASIMRKRRNREVRKVTPANFIVIFQ